MPGRSCAAASKKAGDKVRVSVRFIDGNSGVDVESEQFEQPKGDVFAMRDAPGRGREFPSPARRPGSSASRNSAGTTSVAAWTIVQRAENFARMERPRLRGRHSSERAVSRPRIRS